MYSLRICLDVSTLYRYLRHNVLTSKQLLKLVIMNAIIASLPKAILAAEIAALPKNTCYIERGKFQVYIVESPTIPNVLLEIGRLREQTFRAVGEGTGNALDIDEYDQYYYQLFIWDRANQQIVGGYRVGTGETIFQQHGIEGFYINSLFKIHTNAYPILKQSIELGRSYIIESYQKGYLPLFLLWQGILSFLLRHPQYRYLIGPVSISKYYSYVTKSMIVDFVKQHYFNEEIAPYFQPRTPFVPQLCEEYELQAIGSELKDLEKFMATIEPAHIKVPILLKQYTKLNARFISFNLDPNFSDALDGLMLLDLKKLPMEIIRMLQEK